jgi:hypothetical protein
MFLCPCDSISVDGVGEHSSHSTQSLYPYHSPPGIDCKIFVNSAKTHDKDEGHAAESHGPSFFPNCLSHASDLFLSCDYARAILFCSLLRLNRIGPHRNRSQNFLQPGENFIALDVLNPAFCGESCRAKS